MPIDNSTVCSDPCQLINNNYNNNHQHQQKPMTTTTIKQKNHHRRCQQQLPCSGLDCRLVKAVSKATDARQVEFRNCMPATKRRHPTLRLFCDACGTHDRQSMYSLLRPATRGGGCSSWLLMESMSPTTFLLLACWVRHTRVARAARAASDATPLGSFESAAPLLPLPLPPGWLRMPPLPLPDAVRRTEPASTQHTPRSTLVGCDPPAARLGMFG